MSTPQALIRATKPFVEEDPGRTWRLFLVTFFVLAAATWLAGWGPHLALRVAGSALLGLTIVRVFIFFHDCLHKAVFKHSAIGRFLMNVFGLLILVPPNVWRDSHNFHHRHTSKLAGSSIGSFPLISVKMYLALSPRQRFLYRAVRHPLNMLFAYITIFGFGMCVANVVTQPKKYWDAALSLLLHAATIAVISWTLGLEAALLLVVLPMTVSCGVGAYLFYSQHTFPGMELRRREDWEHTAAAMNSSSMTRMNPVMHWFTGNIGYHHGHHLNAAVPFYRLPEADRALRELAQPIETSLAPTDVLACLSIHLWDDEQRRMVGFDGLTTSSSES